jgi:hypothetical protein
MLVTMNDTAQAWSATPSNGGELVGVDGAPPSGPGVGRDLPGFDPDSPDDGVGVLGPTAGGVVDRGDLAPGISIASTQPSSGIEA